MPAPAPFADDMKQWLKAVADQQDQAAFGRLFQHFAPRIASFMERGGLNAAEAEEISQETMVTVWRKAALYDPAKRGLAHGCSLLRAICVWISRVRRRGQAQESPQ